MLAAVHIHSQIRSNLSYASTGTYFSSHEVVHQLVLLILFLSFIWLMDGQTWREVEATMKAKQADSSCSMVTRLLGSMCDAVVPVDKSLCLGASGSPQLAALLMHQGSNAGPPLQGSSLMRLVKNEDHQPFQDFMMRELAAARAGFGTQAPIAGSLQIHLRGAFDILVSVELFCSCSLGAEGNGIGPLQYLLGICEQAADHLVQERRHTRDSELMSEEHGRTTQQRQATMTQQLNQISESDSSRCDSDISSESSLLHLETSAWVDVESEQLTFLRWTPGFASLLRHPSQEGEGFLTWLVQEQRQPFLDWLQDTDRIGTARIITLRLPRQGGGGHGRKRSFTCMVFEGTEEPVETSDPSEVRAACAEVRAVRLDFYEHQIQQKDRRSRPTSNRQPNILLWVEMPTKRILKSLHAPSLMFQAGSRLMAVEEANQEGQPNPSLITRITVETLERIINEHTEPSILGTYTLTSGGYQLRTEISLLNLGECWKGADRSWCLLSLSKICLLGGGGSEGKAHGKMKLDL